MYNLVKHHRMHLHSADQHRYRWGMPRPPYQRCNRAPKRHGPSGHPRPFWHLWSHHSPVPHHHQDQIGDHHIRACRAHRQYVCCNQWLRQHGRRSSQQGHRNNTPARISIGLIIITWLWSSILLHPSCQYGTGFYPCPSVCCLVYTFFSLW